MARRATLLVDGEEYFGALREALLQARELVLIAGWDFDSRITLPPREGASEESAQAPLGLTDFLAYLLRTRPGLEIHVVRWRYHWWYRDDREAETRARLERVGVRFHEDGSHPPTGCVHHKVVAIDDALAFCGGMDLTHKRWDTRRHDPGDGRLVDHDGEPYMPVHDTQLCVSGPLARELGAYVRDRWSDGEPPEFSAPCEIWPHGLRIDFRDVRAALSRTLPPVKGREAVRELEALYLDAIRRTGRALYCENQYFTCTRIAEAIAQQARRNPGLQALLVGMERPKTVAELHTMGYGLAQFERALGSTGAERRVRLVAALSSEQVVNLHSKIAFFDDRWLTVGSGNLNYRSMGFDVECNVVLEATSAEHRRRMEALRNDLIAEHTSSELEQVATAVEAHGLAGAPERSKGARRLAQLEPQQLEPRLGPILAPLFDRDQLWVPASIAPLAGEWRSALAPLALVALTILSGAFSWAELPTLAALKHTIEAFLGA